MKTGYPIGIDRSGSPKTGNNKMSFNNSGRRRKPHPKSLENLQPRSPQFGATKIPRSHRLTKELVDAIAALPQVQSGGWSEAYLIEVVLRVWLGLPADYDGVDLEIAKSGGVVE